MRYLYSPSAKSIGDGSQSATDYQPCLTVEASRAVYRDGWTELLESDPLVIAAT